jgi:hypothetical protein
VWQALHASNANNAVNSQGSAYEDLQLWARGASDSEYNSSSVLTGKYVRLEDVRCGTGTLLTYSPHINIAEVTTGRLYCSWKTD